MFNLRFFSGDLPLATWNPPLPRHEAQLELRRLSQLLEASKDPLGELMQQGRLGMVRTPCGVFFCILIYLGKHGWVVIGRPASLF